MIKDLEDLDDEYQMIARNVLKKISSGQAQSKDLAAYVVAYRVLGFDQEFASFCMSELMRRRYLGEEFEFERFIEEKSKELEIPPLLEPMNVASFGLKALIGLKL